MAGRGVGFGAGARHAKYVDVYGSGVKPALKLALYSANVSRLKCGHGTPQQITTYCRSSGFHITVVIYAVQDVYNTDPTHETCARLCKVFFSHPVTWAESYR